MGKTLAKLLILTGLCTAVSLFTGCPDPYKPISTESPTPIVSAKPTSEPTKTPSPTQTPELDYVDISGKVEDCENHGTGRSGTVAFYDTENTDGSYSDPIAIKGIGSNKTSTDSSGNFSVTLDKLVSLDSNDKVYVRAVAGTESDIGSYTRTIDLPANQDHNPITDPRGNPAVRVTLYDNPNNNYDYGLLDTEQKRNDFVTHVGRGNIWSKTERETAGIQGFVNGNRDHGLKKWNYGELPDTAAHPILKGIKISKFIPNWETIKPTIQSSGYQGIGQIQIVEEDNPAPEQGWGIVYKSPAGAYASLWDSYGEDGYLEHFEVYLNTTAPEIILHEAIWHGLMGCVGHSNGPIKLPEFPEEKVRELFSSIGRYTGDSANYLEPVDTKMNSIIQEQTYLGMESSKRILGSWQ